MSMNTWLNQHNYSIQQKAKSHFKSNKVTLKSLSIDCENDDWVGDGYCDDTTNNMVCNYDGGDCCGSNINTQYCSECQCLDGNNGTTTTTPVYGNR
jgi:hypothetical protein